MRLRAFACGLGLVALGACDTRPPSTPEGAYRAFAEAVRGGDLKTAYGSLSESTRRAIEARSKAISDASQGAIQNDPGAMVFASGVKPREIGSVSVVDATATQATLEVVSGSDTQRVRMVKDGTRWAIDLSEAFLK